MDEKTLENLMKAIHGWLSTQGYPLEMRTARSFLNSGFGVRQGWHYDDPETGASREQDVLATHQIAARNILVFQVIIECKKSSYPFVAFTYGPSHSKSMGESWNPANPMGRQFLAGLKSATIFDHLPIYESSSPIAYSIVQAPVSTKKQKQKKKGGIDAAYEVLMTVTKASFSLSQLYTTKVRTISTVPDSNEQLPVAYLGYPLIVVDAPLVACHLDDQNEPALSHVDELIVEWSYPSFGNLQIKLVSIEVLDDWVKKARESMIVLDRDAREILTSLNAYSYVG